MPANITSTFNLGTKISAETDWGTAASGEKNGRMWWEGGKWVNIISQDMPTIQDNQATILPVGHAGDRRINQQSPVVGRKWSEGGFNAPVTMDFLALLLYGAMGSASSVRVSSTTASLLVAEPINANPKSLVLLNQPSDSGAILRFSFQGGVTIPQYSISISGIDAYGQGASELITSLSTGEAYSRTSWSSIGASGISIAGLSGTTSVTITGVQSWQHTFTNGSVSPSFSIEARGTPLAGEASANQAFIMTGELLRELHLETDAEAVDGLFMANADFEGNPTALSAATSLHNPSPLRIWPSWGLQVTRDNGVSWNVVENITINHNTGNRTYRAAAGVQNPQGPFSGATEITGDITILVNNELEFKKWQNASQIRMYANWTTPWKLTGTVNMNLSASLPAFLENVQGQESNGAWSLQGNFRVVRDDNFAYAYLLTSGMPGRVMHPSLSN